MLEWYSDACHRISENRQSRDLQGRSVPPQVFPIHCTNLRISMNGDRPVRTDACRWEAEAVGTTSS